MGFDFLNDSDLNLKNKSFIYIGYWRVHSIPNYESIQINTLEDFLLRFENRGFSEQTMIHHKNHEEVMEIVHSYIESNYGKDYKQIDGLHHYRRIIHIFE